MKRFLGLALTAMTFVCACSTISQRQTLSLVPLPSGKIEAVKGYDPVAQDHAWEKSLREADSSQRESTRLLVRYLQAQLWAPIDAPKSCSLWLQVTDNAQFPLAGVAKIRALETCPKERKEVAAFGDPEVTKNLPNWLTDLAEQVALRRAVRDGDKAGELAHSITNVQIERIQIKQVELLQRALELAKKLKDEAAEAQARDTLERIAPRFIKDPPPQHFMTVANDFRRAREFDEARSYFSKIRAGEFSDAEKLRALDGIRMSYKLEQKREKYIDATHEWAEFARQKFYIEAKKKKSWGDFSKYLETRLTLARAVWTENRAGEARKILEKAEKEVRGRTALDESMLTRARIEEEAGRLANAVQILSSIDLSKVRERALKQKILWFQAWNLRKLARYKESADTLRKLINEEDSTTSIARDHYWLGRVLAAQGDEKGARDEFEWLITNDTVGYYGALAYRELKRELPRLKESGKLQVSGLSVPGSRMIASDSKALPPDERVTVDWLIATNEHELAKKYLDNISYARRKEMNDEQTLDFLQLYARSGNYLSLFARLSELDPKKRDKILQEEPELIFPRGWRELVEASSKKNDIPPELPFSIMRQESAFNPKARSPADAFGLMQLIPEIAKRANLRAKVDYKRPEDMYVPEINIPLGSAFLRELLGIWDGHFIPAVASYNASEKAVANWLRTRDRSDAIQFIEDIPYEETKGYVKLVMRNFVFYSRLNTDANSIVFPEWCLNGLQDIKP